MRVARRELMSVNVWQHCDAVKTKIVISAALALAAELGLQRRLSAPGSTCCGFTSEGARQGKSARDLKGKR